MRMLVLYLGYYALAMLLGFLLRSRFDHWIYTRPHMQRRLVLYSSDVLRAVDDGVEAVDPPPSTVDTDAISPLLEGGPLGRFVRPTEADRRIEAARQQSSEEAESEGADVEPPAPSAEELARQGDLSGAPPASADPVRPA